MLMDVPSNTNKPLDGFYNELRRKYPDAFTLVTDLGRRNGSLQKLPRLEKTPSPILGIPPTSPNVASWSPDSFLSKVKYQKTHNEQRKEVDKPPQSGNAVIIKDQAIPMPTWTRKDYLDAQSGASFQLPTLRTQIEQNKVELKNRLNPPTRTVDNQRSTRQTSNSVQAKPSSDYHTTKSTLDNTTTKTSRDHTTNDYATTKTSRDCTANDYATTKTSRDYTKNDYATTKTSRDYTTNDYTTTKTSRDYTTNDYTTTKTSRDYTTNDYATTKTSRDCTANDYATTKTSKDYTTEYTNDYTTTKNSRDYTTNDYATTKTSRDYTTNDYATTKTSRDYTTNDYATTKTSKDYNTNEYTNDYTTTKTSRDYTTNDYATTKTSRDYTTNDYTTTKPTNNYTTTMPTKDYITTQTIRDYTTPMTSRDYTTTKSTNEFTPKQTPRDYNTTKPTKDYPTTKNIRDYNNTNDYMITKTTKDYPTTMATKGYTNTGDSCPSQSNVSGVKSDPLGTIMKELLPNKPSRLMKDVPKTTNRLSNKAGCVSDSDSGVSMCSPMKVFRPKIRSPQAPPAPRDIIKRFSAKPKRTSEPVKADHSLVRENTTQIVQLEDNPVTRYLKSSINFNDKIPQGPPRARVHFEDESEEDAEFRYQERRLLDRTPTTKMRTNTVPVPQIKYKEENAKPETTERSSSPSKEGEKTKSPDQQAMTLPHRRQPFPPNVAKKVLIDIPRGGLPSRRMPQIRVPPLMRDMANQQFSPRNVTSLDGITMSFKNTHELGEQAQSVRATKGDEGGHHSLSSLETLESGTTEASSEFTIMKMEWGASNSSIGSGNQSKSSSQNRDLNLDHPSQNKEISFYSKVRRSLRLKKKQNSEAPSGSRHSDFIPKNSKDLEPDQNSSTSIQLDRGVHGSSSPYGAAVRRLPNQTAADDGIPSRVDMNRTKKDVMGGVETQAAVKIHPVKVPYSPMRMVQSLLKKGRAKDYVVRVPSPPPQEARPPTSSVHSSRYRREQIPSLTSGRVLATQSDSSRLVELQRPKTGFSGLYLTKKNQHGYSGLYVVQLSGAFTSSFPQGILEVGDEVLEINRLQAKDLRLDEIYTLLEESSCVLRVSRNVSSSS